MLPGPPRVPYPPLPAGVAAGSLLLSTTPRWRVNYRLIITTQYLNYLAGPCSHAGRATH